VLELGPDRWLLDVGTGRGYPALYLAATTGCSVVGINAADTSMAESNPNPTRLTEPAARVRMADVGTTETPEGAALAERSRTGPTPYVVRVDRRSEDVAIVVTETEAGDRTYNICRRVGGGWIYRAL
jgi:hypothetical protein